MIYFMQATGGGPVKIGCSVDIDRRREQLESYYGKPLALLKVLPGDQAEEQAIHSRFAAHRIGRTEQFRPAPDLMEFLGRPLLVDANPNAVEAMSATATSLSVKLPADVIESVRIVAAYRNVTMTGLLGEILRPILARMEQEEIAKRTRAEKPAPHPKRKGAGR